ncbi:MAG: hypothetical protein J6L69_10330 [Lachnospiraceae bacterium]|nr:hypothetical protein [Lachnospiraceae bacterium]
MKLKERVTLRKGSVERYADTEEALAKLKKMGYKEVVSKVAAVKEETSSGSKDNTSEDEKDEKNDNQDETADEEGGNSNDTLEGHLDAGQFADYSYQELQKLAKEMGLKASGSKDDLIERLVAEKVSVPENATEGSDEDKK